MEILTPREVLNFSCRMRLGLTEEVTKKRVDNWIERLNLQECQDSRIGGWLKRGISGGERKRVSIGCEIITEPSILLLDEPTSGLDSQCAMNVIK